VKPEHERIAEEVAAVIASDIRAEFGPGRLFATPETMRRLRRVIANTAASLMDPPVDVETFLQGFDVSICERTNTVSITKRDQG
jgi:hypothetical protein